MEGMQGRAEGLAEKLEGLLKEAAEVAAALQAVGQPAGRVPHYSEIELAAHAVGRRLSRGIQQRGLAEVTAKAAPQVDCPDCGRECVVRTQRRKLGSIDGPVEVLEAQGYCDRCRRSFFPSAEKTGLGRAGVDTGAGAADRVRGGRGAFV